MRPLFAVTFTFLLFFLVFRLQPSQAQTAPVTTTAAGSFNYDLSLELTVNGTVASVLTKPAPGMLAGSHLLLTTLSGPVDVSLGGFGMQGKGAFSVVGGEQVEVTGIMKSFKGRQVLLARMVKVADQAFAIRNEHGIPITPQARGRASQDTQNRETR